MIVVMAFSTTLSISKGTFVKARKFSIVIICIENQTLLILR